MLLAGLPVCAGHLILFLETKSLEKELMSSVILSVSECLCPSSLPFCASSCRLRLESCLTRPSICFFSESSSSRVSLRCSIVLSFSATRANSLRDSSRKTASCFSRQSIFSRKVFELFACASECFLNSSSSFFTRAKWLLQAEKISASLCSITAATFSPRLSSRQVSSQWRWWISSSQASVFCVRKALVFLWRESSADSSSRVMSPSETNWFRWRWRGFIGKKLF